MDQCSTARHPISAWHAQTNQPGHGLAVEIAVSRAQRQCFPAGGLDRVSQNLRAIAFRVGYSRDDIDPRGTYSLQASIVESDGRLAFTNDTAYDVVTRGNPDR